MPRIEHTIWNLNVRAIDGGQYADVRFWLKDGDEVLNVVDVRVYLEAHDNTTFKEFKSEIVEKAKRNLFDFVEILKEKGSQQNPKV